MCVHSCVGHSVTPSFILLTFLAASLGQALVGVLLGSQVFNTSPQLGEVGIASSISQRWKLRLWISGKHPKAHHLATILLLLSGSPLVVSPALGSTLAWDISLIDGYWGVLGRGHDLWESDLACVNQHLLSLGPLVCTLGIRRTTFISLSYCKDLMT